MRIENVFAEPEKSLQYMERLVNDGSPSHFSFKFITSQETSPLFVSQFNMCVVKDFDDKFMSYGDLSTDNCFDGNRYIYIHPDWGYFVDGINIQKIDKVVYPTSSSRTVRMLNPDIYVKMAYPGILGRITRELRTEHIYSSIDITSILNLLIQRNDAPSSLSFFPEKGGRVYKSKYGEIGYVIRETKPAGKNTHRIQAIIPAFSLFSEDRGLQNSSPLIIQILNSKNSPKDYLLNELIYPIIDVYFFCVFSGGIQPEMHSQNFMVGIDSQFQISSIILRDLESMDKDISIMQKNKLNINLLSFPFKCISDNQYNYKIKHSFMFDHKLGEYFFDPLIRCVNQYGLVMEGEIEKAIKTYVRETQRQNLIDFFPDDGLWYKFENILIDRSVSTRPYISDSNIKYR